MKNNSMDAPSHKRPHNLAKKSDNEAHELLVGMRKKNPWLSKLEDRFDLFLKNEIDPIEIPPPLPPYEPDPQEEELPPLPLISFFKPPISNVTPNRAITLLQVYEAVKGPYLVSKTESIRRAADKRSKNVLKCNTLPFITPAALLSHRSAKGLIQLSGYIVLDIDEVEDVEATFQWILDFEEIETQLLFRSPSGYGIKWIIEYPLNIGNHQDWFNAFKRCIESNGGPKIDPSGKDIARACFLCHDPKAFINPKFFAP